MDAHHAHTASMQILMEVRAAKSALLEGTQKVKLEQRTANRVQQVTFRRKL